MLLITLFACKPTATPPDSDSGLVDSGEPCEELTWYVDADGDGVGGSDTLEACEAPNGAVDVGGDCDDTNADVFPAASEVCNGIDDDCDGLLDDDDDSLDTTTLSTFYSDGDGAGFGDAAVPVEACAEGDGIVADDTDCDDTQQYVFPGADEVCNGVDDDCDVDVDEEALDATTWYADSDSDDYGDPNTSEDACDQPAGFVADDTDCDDTRFETNPFADELCNTFDDDCDGDVDEDSALDAPTWYTDSDTDGYGDATSSTVTCDQPTGMVSDDTDCDDTDGDTYPDADEYCDGHDDDCDGDVDEASAVDASIWLIDSDADGYGDASTTQTACDQPSGYVSAGGDCDDSDEDRNPGETEICDGFDNDCDGSTQEHDMASFDDGTGWADVTSSVVGSSGAAAAHTISDDGSLMFCDGTFYVNLTVEADVEIYSESGDQDAVVLDGASDGSVVHIDGPYDVYIDDVTIQKGDAAETVFLGGSYDGGGGVACLGDSAGTYLSIYNVVFENNSGTLGGNFTLSNCETELTDVTVTDADATYGHIAFVDDSDLTIDNSSFSDGSSSYAGIYTYQYSGVGGDLWITDSEFTDNSTSTYGVIINSDAGDITIDSSSFRGNTLSSSSYASVIFNSSSSATLDVTDTDFGTLSAGDDNTGGYADVYWASDYYEAGDDVSFDCTTDCGTYTTTDVVSGSLNASYETYGNVFLATEDATLHTWSAQLGKEDCSTATLFVAASNSLYSGYEMEFVSSSQTLGSSVGTESAGTTDIAIEAGRYYVLGTTSSCDIYHRYGSSGGTEPDWGSKQGYVYSASEETGAVGDSTSFSVSGSTSIYFDHTYYYTVLD
ncbi:MAG: hypothetical protein GY884_22920 [Proteobacteria bacterium]|nr:hypothetical protein [Pseudomonadota bacterium]